MGADAVAGDAASAARETLKLAAWAAVIAHYSEGLVAKEEASPYEAGPTRRWLKVKQKGWTDVEDRWKRRVGAARA